MYGPAVHAAVDIGAVPSGALSLKLQAVVEVVVEVWEELARSEAALELEDRPQWFETRSHRPWRNHPFLLRDPCWVRTSREQVASAGEQLPSICLPKSTMTNHGTHMIQSILFFPLLTL